MVTAFRIIDREEKTDEIIENILTSRNIPRSQLPGRPKRWRKKCFDMMEESIANRLGSGCVWMCVYVCVCVCVCQWRSGRWGGRERVTVHMCMHMHGHVHYEPGKM